MSSTQSQCILVSIYNHPNQYPPTANAIELLSNEFSEVFLTYRPNDPNPLTFANNVYPSPWVKEECSSQSLPAKVIQFWKFIRQMMRVVRKEQPDVILVYDNLALYALHWVLKFCKSEAFLWYHNHDIPQHDLIRKYSIGWFAAKIDRRTFSKLDLFTVPTEERLSSFPVDILKGKTQLIPNYPMLRKKSLRTERDLLQDGIKLLFQGRVTRDRGIEDSIRAFPSLVANGLNPYLKIIGPMDASFESELYELIKETKMHDRVIISGPVAYNELALETEKHHIGIAGIKPIGINYQSAGTASNKIYEYAAAGLPILFFDSPHYNSYLSDFQWAFASDFSSKSIAQCLSQISNQYEHYSAAARKDFEDCLNYEYVFLPVLEHVKSTFA